MRKFLLAAGGSCLLVLAGSGITIAQTNTSQDYPQKPKDAAGINEIQGQVNSTYFQNNSLKQGAGNVSQGSGSGAADLLKNSSEEQTISVSGTAPNPETTPQNNQRFPLWAMVLFVLIITAPLLVIIKMLRDLRAQPQTETTRENSELDENNRSVESPDTTSGESLATAKMEQTKQKTKKKKKSNKTSKSKKKKKK